MKKKKKNSNKINRLMPKPLKAFIITFVSVIAAGSFMMLFIMVISGKNVLSVFSYKDGQVDGSGFHFFWESIPEKGHDDGDPDGSRYGRILADKKYMVENRIYEKAAKNEEVVTLGFAGDILFDDEYAVMANLLRRGTAINNGLSEALLATMQDVDIMMVNNEFAYTNRGNKTEGKQYTFRAEPNTVSYLDDMGVDLVSLANNHVYDYGEAGLIDTLDTLQKAEIPYVGAGKNIKDASDPVYFIVNDIKIAFVSATQIERLDHPDTVGAGDHNAGVFRCWNPDKLYTVISQAKENSDFVVVYIHWGTENESKPDWAQLKQAPEIAQAGADLIIGDHPHCLQGIEYFGKTPVIYSLGNFWFNSKPVDTGMLQVEIGKEGIRGISFIPALQSDSRTDLAYGTDKDRILSCMRLLSPGIQIDQEGKINKNTEGD